MVDDSEGTYTGTWEESTKQAALVGNGYRHDGTKGKGEKTARFTATITETGEYEVRVLYSATNNRCRLSNLQSFEQLSASLASQRTASFTASQAC